VTAAWPGEPAIVVISGMQGAGKSTVAEALAARLSRSACVHADTLQRMVVGGAAWPEAREMSNEAGRQLRLRLHNACLLAWSFRAAGFAAVVDDIVIGDRVQHLLEEMAGERFFFAMLTPRLEAVIERERGRGTSLYEAWAWMDEEVRERTPRIGLWLDTTDMTVEETVDVVLARLDEAKVN
jgi:cytidylate kinase